MFGAVHPYTALDDRYLRILDGTVSEFSTEDDVKRIKQAIVTMTLIRTPIPMNVFAGFLRLQEVDLRNVTLHHLHSLIIVPDPGALNGSPHIFHLSFRPIHYGPAEMFGLKILLRLSRGRGSHVLAMLRSDGA